MNHLWPTYDQWLLFFLGATLVILASNIIQWVIRKERVYALYTAYVVIWIGFFLIHTLSFFWVHFLASIVLQFFAILFYELAILFLNLKSHPRPLRIFRIGQWAMVFFILLEVVYFFFTPIWQQPEHEFYLNIGRILAQLLMVYSLVVYFQHPNRLATFFVIGTACMLAMQGYCVYLLSHYGEISTEFDLPMNTRFLFQFAILIDMACVSLGLSYRQRQETIRQVVREQEMNQERERHVLQQLEADLHMQRLQQEKTNMQMRALQSQVNPHFLFNALNTLSSLIEENPQQATHYVDEMSTVYRYLLRSVYQELTTLSCELEFVHSYYHLLKTRHGQGIVLNLSIDENFLAYQLPPLTLQLLIENAVKHNVILPEQPLTISIGTTPDGWLVVENNIQKRSIRVESNGIGLANISDKYRLLNQPLPQIDENEGRFRVSLALIAESVSIN